MNNIKYFVIGGFENGLYNHFPKEDINKDDIFNVKACANLNDYVEMFKSKEISLVSEEKVKNLEKTDVIIINSELLYNQKDQHTNYNGITLLKWFRISLKLLNPILMVGIENSSKILNKIPKHFILFAPANYYLELPLIKDDVQKFIFGNESMTEEKEFKTSYKPFVQVDFETLDIGHNLANEFGLYLMEKVYKEVLDLEYKINTKHNFSFDKAEFLFDYNLSKKDNENLKTEFISVREKIIDKKIIYIDDQGGDEKNKGWFHWMKSILNIENNNFKGIFPNIKDDQFDLEETFKTLKNSFRVKPNLIFLDLRLLGDSEKGIPLKKVSGAMLLKKIKKWDASIPVIIVSATDRLKSLAFLQKFPYCAENIWSKPRIEKGDVDLNESLNQLLVKTKKAIVKYKINIERSITRSKYQLQDLKNNFEEKSKVFNLSSLKNYDYIFIDTNFFCETKEILVSYHNKLYSLCKYLNDNSSCKLVIIDDVWTELFLNSIKDLPTKSKINKKKVLRNESFKLISKYSLNQLLEYKKLGHIKRLPLEENYAKQTNITPETIEDSVSTSKTYYKVTLTQTIQKNYCFTKKEADEKMVKLNSKKVKTLIHADDIFRIMIKNLSKKPEKSKILFISDDVRCKKEIALELRYFSKDIIFSNDSLEEFLTKEKFIIKNTNEDFICNLMTNKEFAKKVKIK